MTSKPFLITSGIGGCSM